MTSKAMPGSAGDDAPQPASATIARLTKDIEALTKQLEALHRQEKIEQDRLDNFDDLDFNVYNDQDWRSLSRSHADDIVVHYADGGVTKGLDDHIAMLKPLFHFAPDHRITDHPIRIASGEFTAVMGVVTGTFSQPMSTADGRTIAPTGRTFDLNMVTIGRWEGTKMVEEWLFLDNQSFLKQLGLAP